MRTLLALVSGIILLCGCSTTETSLYSLYDYEGAIYRYSKKATPELRDRLLQEYRRIIDRQHGVRRTVPPGMYAEYGFLLYRMGYPEEGIPYLKEEIRLYPESETYLSRIIKQLEKK